MNERLHVLRDAAAAAVRAPSSHNTQPWRFEISGDRLLVFADYRRHLATIDPEARQLVISCGCALLNARVLVRAWGYDDVVTFGNDPTRPDLLATLELGERIVTPESDLALLLAIAKRATNRGPFLTTPVSRQLASEIAETAAIHRGNLVRLGPQHKLALAEVIACADELQLSDPAFRHELASWLIPFASRRHDGIPFVVKEYGSAMPFTLRRTLGDPELGKRFAHIEEQLVYQAPFIAVLGTDSDDPVEWLRCGQALEAVLLHATSRELSAAFLNQVLEVPELRSRVASLTGLAYPQIIIRLGYPAEPIRRLASCRDVTEVLS